MAMYSINVTDPPYNAVGDGTTDDHAALQLALDHSNSYGYVVEIPKGIYYISDRLHVYGQTTIKGQGEENTVIKCELGGFYAQNSAGSASEITIERLTLEAVSNQVNNCKGIELIGDYHNSSKNNIRHVLVKKINGIGIRLYRPILTHLTQVIVQQCTGNGFSIEGDGTSTTLENCYATGNTGHGYNWTNVGYSSLINCASDGNQGDGYHFDAGSTTNVISNISLYSCGAELNQGNQFYLFNVWGLTITTLGVNIGIPTMGKNMLELDYCRYVTITGCAFRSTPPSPYHSLLIGNNGAENITIISSIFGNSSYPSTSQIQFINSRLNG